MTLARRLKELREAKKISQRKLASILNISSGAVGMYETGKRAPDYELLSQIADFFGVSIDYLLGRTDDPTPPQAKQDKPNFEEYVLSAPTLSDATIRIAELDSRYGMDDKTFTHLSRLAFNKHGLASVKGSEKAAGGIKTPGTGALEDTEKDDND